jgi:pimeloyl-ACP methyl ester carboxylesterase
MAGGATGAGRRRRGRLGSPPVPVTSNGTVRLHWEESGAGEPVLLVHGLGYTLDMWHRTVPVLEPRRRVIRLDNRGVGGSDVPDGPYRIADMADDAVAVLDAAGVERADVAGASLGGPSPRRSPSGTRIGSAAWCSSAPSAGVRARSPPRPR